MRSWPLDSFRNQPPKSQGRGSNPWNGEVGRKCFDCGCEATLWVEDRLEVADLTAANSMLNGRAFKHVYAKLCEGCYALRVLGDSCKSPTPAVVARFTTTV